MSAPGSVGNFKDHAWSNDSPVSNDLEGKSNDSPNNLGKMVGEEVTGRNVNSSGRKKKRKAPKAERR